MHLQRLTGSDLGNTVDSAYPILTDRVEVENAHVVIPHSHHRGQLIYAANGVLRVSCDHGSWLVPPCQAVWVPPHIEHGVRGPHSTTYCSLFVDTLLSNRVSCLARLVSVTPLLRELVLTATTFDDNYTVNSPESRLVAVLSDQLANLQTAELSVPLAREHRVRRVLDQLIENPADDTCIPTWAQRVGTSPRNLERLFIKHTGLSFGNWRRRLKVMKAVERLDSGASVTSVAFDLGYKSPNAFITMFRRTTGESPLRYLRANGAKRHVH